LDPRNSTNIIAEVHHADNTDPDAESSAAHNMGPVQSVHDAPLHLPPAIKRTDRLNEHQMGLMFKKTAVFE